MLSWPLLILIVLPCGGGVAADPAPPRAEEYKVLTLRGKVVWQAEAIERLFGIQSVPEAKQRVLLLESETGDLFPLVEDIRGRAFRRDERLRDVRIELLVRQYHGSPLVQVIKVFALDETGKFELDYWCEICSIAMFELKACDCCQGPIDLRRRPVE